MTRRGEVNMEPTIDEILIAFEQLIYGGSFARTSLHKRILTIMDAAPNGLIAPELVEAVLGRELTREEDDLIVLQTEPADGHG
jgi:hypothetical protein